MKEPNDYKKLYWDLLESWSDLKIKHGCAIEENEQLRKERDELQAKLDANTILMNETADTLNAKSAEIQGAFKVMQAKLDKSNNTGEIITAKLNDLESAFSKLCLTHSVKLEHLEKAKDCLGQISRMTTLPDHASNTMTLVAAHQRARATLEEIE